MDVAKAAERLRKHFGGETRCSVYRDHPHKDEYWIEDRYFDDLKELAEAYLAEHPSDSETPLDVEFLRSVGFDADEDQAELRLPDFCHPDWPEDPIMTMLVINKDGLCYLSQGPDESANWPRLITTRGDLRHLAKALGIELATK